MSMKRLVIRAVLLALVLGLLTASPSQSQAPAPGSCDPIIAQLDVALAQCKELNRNHACYGNLLSEAQPLAERFDSVQDRVPIETVSTIDTYDPAGAVVMYLTPADSAPINALLLGSASLGAENVSPALVTLSTVGADLLCERTPNGMMIETDDGARGRISVNGIDIELGSAAYVTTEGANILNIDVVRGSAQVTIPGPIPAVQVVTAGNRARIAGVAAGQPSFTGPPSPSPLAGSAVMQFLAGSAGLSIVSDPNSVYDPAIPPCGGEIKFGEPIFARNYVPGQECLYWFCADKGDIVTVNLDAADDPLNTWIDLRAPNLKLIRWNNDISRTNTNSLICNHPLQETGCYTIVARPHRNRTIGSFRLTLSGHSWCAQPEARCEVVTLDGLNLRTGPGLAFPRILTLSPGTRLFPEEWTADNNWVKVQAVDLGQEGWVNTSLSLLSCEPPPPVTDQPPLPVDAPPPDPCDKCTPWSGYGP